jgi:hypothetical protein
MSVSPNPGVDTIEPICPQTQAGFITRCQCGRAWNMTMKRGESGHPGCVRCSCQAELISWSGTVIFHAAPVDVD